MTLVDDRIAMAEVDHLSLDEWFERLERMPVPEGFRVEIVEGSVYMTPQRGIHFDIIQEILWALEDHFGRRRAKWYSDVRIDFPGQDNGFCPDVVKMREGTSADEAGQWRHEDVEFVAEVISRGTARNDYGPKKIAYAKAEVPVYLIADPYQGKCHVYTDPKDGDYTTETTITFGTDVDLTHTPLGLTIKTADFPRD
ncbi:Uma2 family endonuclease [Streptomyces sp. NPDC006997]|uniref:Uma2 family endonuclease n=1 Tax=Streptomyces sp. NPDC006997 TaxID=3155356 RepID=UPI0033DE8838